MKILNDQIERESKENKSSIMMGDANLCAQKWDEEEYRLFNLAAELKS
jgi:exonuclease III